MCAGKTRLIVWGVGGDAGRIAPRRQIRRGAVFTEGLIKIAGEKRIDWPTLMAEYVGGASYGDLSKKYNLSKSTIYQHSKAEGWQMMRMNAANAARTKTIQKTADAAADNAIIAAGIKRKALLMIDRLFDEFSSMHATERRESSDDAVDIKRLRDLTAAYKDLTDDMPKTNTGDDVLAAAREILGGIHSAVE